MKSEIDPNMTLWISPGINADSMEVVDGRACLVESRPDKPSPTPPHTDRHVPADLADPKENSFLFGKTELFGTTYPAPGTFEGLQTQSSQ